MNDINTMIQNAQVSQPGVRNMIGSMANGSWEGLFKADPEVMKKNQEMIGASKEKALEAANKYVRVFNTPDGHAVLDELLSMTLRRPSYDGNRSFDENTAYGLMRTGQNQIVATILKMLAFAEVDLDFLGNVSSAPAKKKTASRKKKSQAKK